MEFSRQEYWSGLPHPTPEDLPNSGFETAPVASPALVGRLFTTCATWEPREKQVWAKVLSSHLASRAGRVSFTLSLCLVQVSRGPLGAVYHLAFVT